MDLLNSLDPILYDPPIFTMHTLKEFFLVSKFRGN